MTGAWQKGLRYGTIVVDLERREVVDVLSDRSAEATGRWLGQPIEQQLSRAPRPTRQPSLVTIEVEPPAG